MSRLAVTAVTAPGGQPPDAAVVAVGVRRDGAGPDPTPGARAVAGRFGLDLDRLLAAEHAKGEPGELVAAPVADPVVERVLFVGVGDGSPADLRRAAAAAGRAARRSPSLTLGLAAGGGPTAARAVAEAVQLATYGFSRRSGPEPRTSLATVTVLVDDRRTGAAAVDRAVTAAAATELARDLVNTPSMEKTPAWLAEQAVAVGQRAGLAVRVRDQAELAVEGFGGILAVGQGSASPPRLVEMSYTPRGRDAGRHVVLVGKGITFDSGGLSLKPADSMITMKTDMAGGAAVIAAMGALAALDVRVRVTGLVPAAENMPSGSAQRPSDVIRHYGGRTVEVLNTDAEGRLVLADALAYADARLDPDVIVDLATLTGAASLGLGRQYGALYATDDALATALLDAAGSAGELLWRMPLVADYRDALDSDIADLRNVGDPGRHYSGGSITAALFLREFVGRRRWAHLDIAGPARSEKNEGETGKGGTGYGVRLLLEWLASRR